MHSTQRRLWYIPGVLLSLLVVAALILTQTGSRVSAEIAHVEVSSTTVQVGEPVTLSVRTGTGVEVVQATINGAAVFESTGDTNAELPATPGYGGEAEFTIIPQQPGQITVDITTPGTGDTESVTITIVPEGGVGAPTPPAGESPAPSPTADTSPTPSPTEDPGDDEAGTFTPQPGPEVGLHIARWGGGNISEAVEAAPGAVSLWVTVNGRYVGYIPGAPAFVNASFLAAFPGGDIPAGTMMLVVIR